MYEGLKSLREQNNYSQNAIASFLGISRQMYIKYEKGEVEPPAKTIVQLAKFYSVPYEYILDGKTVIYTYKNTELEVASPTLSYDKSSYLDSVLNMLPKLIFSEQLLVLSKLCDMVKQHSADKKEPNKKKQSFEKLIFLNNELNLNSHGQKWTREELYDRN